MQNWEKCHKNTFVEDIEGFQNHIGFMDIEVEVEGYSWSWSWGPRCGPRWSRVQKKVKQLNHVVNLLLVDSFFKWLQTKSSLWPHSWFFFGLQELFTDEEDLDVEENVCFEIKRHPCSPWCLYQMGWMGGPCRQGWKIKQGYHCVYA